MTPPEPYAGGTELCGVILATPLLTPAEFDELRAGEQTVHFFGVIPVHEAEMDLKLAKGSSALLDRLGEAGVSERLDPQRPSVA